MKSTEDYINKVYEKFEETQKNHQYYKKVKMSNHSNVAIITSISLCMVIAITIGIKIHSGQTTNISEENEIIFAESKDDGTIVYTKHLIFDFDKTMTYEKFKKIIENADIIGIISNCDDINSIGVIENNKFKIKTNKKIEFEKILIGEIDNENTDIICTQLGGKLPVEEFENDIDLNWEEWERINLDKNIPLEEKSKSYYEQIYDNIIHLEKGKKYLSFFEYNDSENIYELSNYIYGALEYDSNTNMVKNPITGEFEEFDWSLLENQ